MRHRRTAYVDICPVCEWEVGTFDWADDCCPHCGCPRDEGEWLTQEIDLATHVIIREFYQGSYE